MPKINQVFPNDKSGKLFDYLREKYRLKNDRELSEKTTIGRPTISRIRNGKQHVSKTNKHDISAATGMTIKALDKMIAGE